MTNAAKYTNGTYAKDFHLAAGQNNAIPIKRAIIVFLHSILEVVSKV
jgi:hypothetical protein